MAFMGQPTLKLPRLRVREQLSQACPEAAELFAIQEKLVGCAPTPSTAVTVNKNLQMSTMSAAGRSLLAGTLIEDKASPEELLRQEMEAVKAERARILQQLALIKSDSGKAGGDLQQEDILQLRREVELKKAKLNELHEEVLLKQNEFAKLTLKDQDCARLMPDGCPQAQARLAELKAENEALNTESAEAGAKHRLYTLLEARTKRELLAMAKRVASAQALQAVYKDDEAALLTYVHAMNAALQDALREKHAAGQLYDKTREDWAQKLQARHKEVRDLRHRQQDDLARESRRLKSIADKEAAEEEKRAQLTKQEEEHTLRLQAIQPKVEALEEVWSKLRTITGKNTPDEVIAYWKDLKVQEEEMLNLARLAEARQREATLEINALLAKRSQLLEEADSTAEVLSENDTPRSNIKDMEKLEECRRRSQVAKRQFGKFRDVCNTAQQGLLAMQGRIEAALAKLDPQVTSPKRRRSSEVASGRVKSALVRQGTLKRQSTASWTSSTMRLPPETASAQDQQAMYTIDQDAFFPDLPLLVMSLTEKVQLLMRLADKLGRGPGGGDPKATLPGNEIIAAENLRRRTWTGPPWLAKYSLKGLQSSGQRVDPANLVGYTTEPQIPPESQTENKAADSEWDGVVTRQILKNRAAKVVQKHKASTTAKT